MQHETGEELAAQIKRRVENTMEAQANLRPAYIWRAMWLDIKAVFGYGRRVKRFSLNPPFTVEYHDQ